MAKEPPTILLSMTDKTAGTVVAYFNGETTEIINQFGMPNPGYTLQWKDWLKRLGVKYDYAEAIDPIYAQFQPKDRADVVTAHVMRRNGCEYKEIEAKTGRSRTTIWRWMKKLGMT